MSHQSALIAKDIDEYLAQHERKELLRFITCGSVDDGKSTLIGRLFYESKMIYEDQLAAIAKDSSRYGTTGGKVDLALFTDGLEDERHRIEEGESTRVALRRLETGLDRERALAGESPQHFDLRHEAIRGDDPVGDVVLGRGEADGRAADREELAEAIAALRGVGAQRAHPEAEEIGRAHV